MKFLIKLAKLIDTTVNAIGRGISWLVLCTVILAFLVVVMRDLFGFGRIWIQESYVWMHAIAFMLGAAWTLQAGGHVRVDVLYQKFSPRTRCWVDIMGALFLLLPTCILILWASYGYVHSSILLLEGSRETGGLPGIFILKTIIPAAALLLLLQGLSSIIHNLARLMGYEPITQDTN